MVYMNSVHLIGRLTRAPECRTTVGGKMIGGFDLAVNHYHRSPGGEVQEETDFMTIEVVGDLAHELPHLISRGSLVYVEGRLRLTKWKNQRTGKSGQKLKVTASRVEPLMTARNQKADHL